MNVLEKILGEIGEKFKTADAEKFDCEELCDVEDWYDSGYIYGQLSAHKKCMDIIRSHMDEAKDINVPSNVGWISVEERLPEKTDYYLVQLSRKLPNEDYSDRVVVLFNGEEKEFECYANLIIAWQPLPERYKGDSNA